MRRVTVASGLLTALGCVTMLSACSSGEASSPETAAENAAEVRLTLRADGPDGSLVLQGAPSDPQYVGIYPNPDRWESIELVLGSDGIPVTRCVREGIVTACSETPFFIDIQRRTVVSSDAVSVRTFGVPGDGSGDDSSGDGEGESGDEPDDSSEPTPESPSEPPGDEETTAVVTDVHGKKVAEKKVGGSSGDGSTCGGDAVGGAPGQGGFSKNGATQACTSASLEDRPGCDGSTVEAAAKVYCDAVNAGLGQDDKIDCSVLTDPGYVPSPLPDSRAGGDCSTYWEPARSAVTEAGYGSCEKVTLLLTQWRDRSRRELISNGVCRSSPLILDLDGDGIHLSSLRQGTSFDLLATGEKVWASWTDGKDAFLALDRNGNGVIDDASELFGNASGGESHTDGFAALAELDDDGDGAIDARDRVFSHLLLWRDANRDGVSTESELMTLRDAGIRRLSLSVVRKSGPSSLDAHGNSIPLVTEFERSDGSRGMLVDAFLRYRPAR
jgi:hypothetical protein